MKLEGFLSNTWKEIFLLNSISSFTDLWLKGEIPSQTFATTTTLLRLKLSLGGTTAISIKKHLGVKKKWTKKIFSGQKPFYNQVKYFYIFKKLRIPTTELVYYSTEIINHRICTILVTCPLFHFTSLTNINFNWYSFEQAYNFKRKILKKLASDLHFLHEKKICHHQLNTLHIYIRYHITNQENHQEWLTIILSELTTTHYCFFKLFAKLHDLKKLFASLSEYSRKDKIRFYLYYCQKKQLNFFDKHWLHHILKLA